MLEKVMWLVKLADAYGPLLTERQQMCLDLHYDQDLSLAEIAEQLGVSRQAVHDILKRSEAQLQEYEEKLGLVARQSKRQLLLKQAALLLVDGASGVDAAAKSGEALNLIERLLELPDEV